MRFSRQPVFLLAGVLMANVLTVQPGWSQASADQPAPAVDAVPLPIDRGPAALWQSLRKLQTRASLLMFTGHPDDEDGGVLTYESRGQGAQASLLTLNRGEGGQNVMSNDYWDALGQVRTQELLQADRYYGVQQYWTRVADYGFSKIKEEALEKWSHDRVLYDAVRVVRMARPLVVTSVSVGGPTDGHGNHQIAGVMAQEVFNAAGDPNIFPDQIKAGLLPWKPLKVYARVPFFAATKEGMYDYATGKYVPVRFYDYVNKRWLEGPLSSDVEIPSSNYDPVLGQNYVQIARYGLGFQKSQNGGIGPIPAGVAPSSGGASAYHRFASAFPAAAKEKSFFDGIDTSLMGIAELAKGGDAGFLKPGLTQINAAVQEAVSKFDVQRPEQVAPSLAHGIKATRALMKQVESSSLSAESKYNVQHELRVKERQFNDAIAQALGISLLATVAPEQEAGGRTFFAVPAETFGVAIPGQTFWVKVSATNPSATPVTVEKLALITADGPQWQVEAQGQMPGPLANNRAGLQRFKVTVPSNAKLTRPYFTRKNEEQAWYDINDERYLNLPTSPYPLAAELQLNYEGEPIRLAQVVQTVERITGAGWEFQPLIVGPALSVSITPKSGIVPLGGTKFNLTVSLHNNVKGPAKGTLRLDVPSGWNTAPAQANYSFTRDGEELHVDFTVTPAKLQPAAYQITAVAEYNGEKFTEGYEMPGYPGLRRYPLYAPATFHTRGVDIKVAGGLRVGYVMGTGDDVPKSLEEIGVRVQFLSPQEIASADLGRFDCIVLGVRAYAARNDLITYNRRILQYVQDGGVVFVQYNTAQYDHNYGPYPYSLSNDPEKVVDETAKITVLQPDNPVMSWPNKITSADFDGWIEERGHGFMKDWDPHYVPLTEVHDPDQEPQKGGLLYARYGKGAYIYAAYAFYRQLPKGVPGAFRLIANILSLSRSPELKGGAAETDKQ